MVLPLLGERAGVRASLNIPPLLLLLSKFDVERWMFDVLPLYYSETASKFPGRCPFVAEMNPNVNAHGSPPAIA